MKKILPLIGLCFLFTSCYTTYQTIPQNYDYTESISFTIDKVQEGHSVSTGNGHFYASRGNKFVFVYLTLHNNLNMKQDLDFGTFYLLNPKTKTRHQVEWAMLTSPINIWGSVDSYIRKADTKKRKLVFIFPEDEKGEYLLVNENVIEIKYITNPKKEKS